MTAGYYFPGTGYVGLILIASLIILPAQLTAKARFGFMVFLVSISFLSNMLYHTPAPPDDWQALNTTFTDFYDDPIEERNMRVKAIRAEITAHLLNGTRVIITPETVLGLYSPGLAPQVRLLEARAKRHDATLLIGVVRKTDGGLENSLLILGRQADRYGARQPVPLVMWNLWPTTGFRAHWFRSGVREIDGKRTALLICWEELVPWPMLLSSFGDPEIIVSASNHGWAEAGSRIWDYQSLNARALARLYGLPLLRAVNLPQQRASPDGNDGRRGFQ
jgi:apolipoprotein N-acyltransferase